MTESGAGSSSFLQEGAGEGPRRPYVRERVQNMSRSLRVKTWREGIPGGGSSLSESVLNAL